jgi:quercetin dioxygenase-like cupin family protein
MRNRRILVGGAGALPALPLDAQSSAGRSIVFEHDLPDLTLKNSVTVVEVSYAPEESSASHRHPGITIAYVLEGEVISKVGNDPEQHYTKGQMFLETPPAPCGVPQREAAGCDARGRRKQLTTPA